MKFQRLLFAVGMAYLVYFLLTITVFLGVAFTVIHFIAKYW